SRIVFDSHLRDRARDAGAHIVSEKISARKATRIDNGWRLRSDSDGEWIGSMLVGADGANSGIAKMLAGPLPPSDMEVAFGYRAPLPSTELAPTVVAFLPRWVGYAWAFPRPDHISFGIATTQDAFDHEALDKLLWDFMVSYYEWYRTGSESDRSKPGPGMKLWKPAGNSDHQVRSELKKSAERYAARIP